MCTVLFVVLVTANVPERSSSYYKRHPESLTEHFLPSLQVKVPVPLILHSHWRANSQTMESIRVHQSPVVGPLTSVDTSVVPKVPGVANSNGRQHSVTTCQSQFLPAANGSRPLSMNLIVLKFAFVPGRNVKRASSTNFGIQPGHEDPSGQLKVPWPCFFPARYLKHEQQSGKKCHCRKL